jgi:transcriptional regulator with GAF, ATPase, and Fis domain
VSLSITLEKQLQRLKQKDMIHEDINEIAQRAILEGGEVDATINELTDKVKALEPREINLEEQISELEERISEILSHSPNFEEANLIRASSHIASSDVCYLFFFENLVIPAFFFSFFFNFFCLS